MKFYYYEYMIGNGILQFVRRPIIVYSNSEGCSFNIFEIFCITLLLLTNIAIVDYTIINILLL